MILKCYFFFALPEKGIAANKNIFDDDLFWRMEREDNPRDITYRNFSCFRLFFYKHAKHLSWQFTSVMEELSTEIFMTLERGTVSERNGVLN